ncbi:putative copper resistance protein D [Deinococcus reticulitermitis]|uniref:Putative copper resistance protein D n=2 Tax=Deinococcus reticulitermitis TaxID=856736 RepID=A0A1H7CD12_9DEIO|nr:putative copper resistance protein D [Deinococcus reticulitermitis]
MLAKYLIYLGSALLLGGAAARAWRPDGQPGARWLGLGAALILVGGSAQVALTLAALGYLTPADVPAYLQQTVPGRAVLTLLLGTALLLAAGVARWPAWLSMAAAGTLLWGLGGLGHGATHGPSVRLLHTAHAGAMAVWLGGVLTLVSWPEQRLAALARFGPVATVCVLVLGVTGVVASWEHAGGMPTPDSRYGRVLLLKLAFVGAVLGVAGLLRRSLARQGRVDALLSLELALLGLILAVTASLSVTPTPAHG